MPPGPYCPRVFLTLWPSFFLTTMGNLFRWQYSNSQVKERRYIPIIFHLIVLHISFYSLLFSASLVGSCICLRVRKIFHIKIYGQFDMYLKQKIVKQKNVKKLQARTLCVVPRLRWLLSAKSVPRGSCKICFWSLWRILSIVFGTHQNTNSSTLSASWFL